MGLGLLIAVLTDRVHYETVVKAIIFLPMAISFVAAGVIWRFMYDYRPPGSRRPDAQRARDGALGAEPHGWLSQISR